MAIFGLACDPVQKSEPQAASEAAPAAQGDPRLPGVATVDDSLQKRLDGVLAALDGAGPLDQQWIDRGSGLRRRDKGAKVKWQETGGADQGALREKHQRATLPEYVYGSAGIFRPLNPVNALYQLHLAAFYPAVKASRARPVDALRSL